MYFCWANKVETPCIERGGGGGGGGEGRGERRGKGRGGGKGGGKGGVRMEGEEEEGDE